MFSNVSLSRNLILSALLTASTFVGSLSFTMDKDGGSRDGGGGAGSIINGKYFTFAELGIRLVDTGAQVLPEEGLEEALNLIESKAFPQTVFSGARSNILGGNIVYRKFEKVDPKRLAVIQKEYQESIDQLEFKKWKNFAVFAYTWNDEKEKISYTELYPEFFGLDHRQQALVLVHEAHIRKFKKDTTLKNILNVDVKLLEVIKSVETIGAAKTDFSFLYKAMLDAKIVLSKVVVIDEILRQVIEKRGPVNLTMLGNTIENDEDTLSSHSCLRVIPEKVFRARNLHPLFFATFQNAALCLNVRQFVLVGYLGKEVKYFSQETVRIQDLFENPSPSNFVIASNGTEVSVEAINKTINTNPYVISEPGLPSYQNVVDTTLCAKYGMPNCTSKINSYWF